MSESSEIERLKGINRELAMFLREQLEMTLELRQKVHVLERLVEEYPPLKAKAAASLPSVEVDASHQPNPNWKKMIENLFARMGHQ